MSYHVHICSVGKKWELPLAVCQSGYPIDKIILLNSKGNPEYDAVELDVIRRLNDVNIHNVKTIEIDPFDFKMVSNTVLMVCEKEMTEHNGCRFHFNFTSGTNIVAGAICSAAYLIPNSDFYYLREKIYCVPESDHDQIIRIEPSSDRDLKLLNEKGPTAKVFSMFENNPIITNDRLSELTGKNPSALSYHTSILLQYGFITRKDGSVKHTEWEITDKGRKVLEDYNLKNRILDLSRD